MTPTEQDSFADQLARYPLERYPVQHATAQFHLGTAALQAGGTASAVRALTTARDVFALTGMRLEQAKATLMLGVALRTAGRGEQAASAFSTACAELAELGQPSEQAAAAYNLGLVHQDAGNLPAAHTAWEQARELFLRAGRPGQAAAAARDHGGSLLAAGELPQAVALLEQALGLAEVAGDEPGAGAAANVLGLARLAAGQPTAALAALRRALAASPRTLRPAEHAMAKANLALAHEHAGDRERARLAAAQALAVPGAAQPVRAQAADLLDRLPGDLLEDLLVVACAADAAERMVVLREEVLRTAELTADDRRALISGLLDDMLARPGAAYDLAESLLQVVLELPPRTYDAVVRALVQACVGRPGTDADRLRAVVASASARFAMPQWQRLVASLNAAAQAAGEPPTWR